MDEHELTDEFGERLTTELGLVKKLAEGQDATRKAAAITTLRNLTRYLSTEIDAAYKEAEKLAQESDETGRAAALATLRNLNEYLRGRQPKVQLLRSLEDVTAPPCDTCGTIMIWSGACFKCTHCGATTGAS